MNRPTIPECLIETLRQPATISAIHMNLTVDLYRAFIGAEYSYACMEAYRKLGDMGHGGEDPPSDFDDGGDPSEMPIPKVNINFDFTPAAVLAVQAANALLAVLGECAEATGLEVQRRDRLARRAKGNVDRRNQERLDRRDQRLRDHGLEPEPADDEDDEDDDLRGGTIRTDDDMPDHSWRDDELDDDDQDFGNADSQ